MYLLHIMNILLDIGYYLLDTEFTVAHNNHSIKYSVTRMAPTYLLGTG